MGEGLPKGFFSFAGIDIDRIKTIDDVREHLRRLYEDLRKLEQSVSIQIYEIQTGDNFYFGPPNEEGSWRFHRMANGDFQLQKRISGVWTKNAKWS